MIILAAAAFAQAASPVFAPPLNRAITVTVSEERSDGADVQRFTIERRVTFRQRPGGFVAEVETLRADGIVRDGKAKMFEAAAAGLIGRTVRILLDATGAVVDVEDRAGVWAAQVAALEAVVARRVRGPALGTMMAPLRATPPAQQIRRIGDMVAPIIAVDIATAGARETRVIDLPTRTADGAPAKTRGSETVTRDAAGMLRLERVAESATLRTTGLRRVDPASGLAFENVETTEDRSAGTAQKVVRSTLISR